MMLRPVLLLFLLCAVLPAALNAAAPNIPQRMINGRQSVDFIRLINCNGARVRKSGDGHEFISKYFSGRVERDDRRCVINGVKTNLNFPVAYVNGTPYITLFDWYKSFRPLLYPATLKKHPIRAITIDMGHGGSDPGAIGMYSKEKNITLKLGRHLAKILRSYGYKVFLTRNSDIKLPLERIAAIQRSHRSDLFVSVHVNSAKDRSVNGVETFCLTPAYAPSSGSNKTQRNRKRANIFDENNLALAWNIQRNLLRRTKAADRGIKRANFVVLRELNAPGVLVEIGFISNLWEERKLNNPLYIDALARGIADGIVNYRNSIK